MAALATTMIACYHDLRRIVNAYLVQGAGAYGCARLARVGFPAGFAD